MKLRVLTIVLLLFVAGQALAQAVNIEYDQDYSGTIETFAWDSAAGETIKQTSELLHDHFVATIEKSLEAGSFRKVDSDPDVYINYQTSLQDNVKLNTENFGYFVPTNWYAGPYGVAVSGTSSGKAQMVTGVKSYESGTLVVDVWDAENKQLIWRGTAPGIAVSWNPKKIEKRLDKALGKMIAQWKQIRKEAP